MCNAKTLNYMVPSVNYRQLLPLLAGVLLLTFALSTSACRTHRSQQMSQTSIEIGQLEAPRVTSLSQRWTIPKALFDQIRLSDAPITRVDTAAKIGVTISRDMDDALVVEPFAFVANAWRVDGIAMHSSLSEQPPEAPASSSRWSTLAGIILLTLLLCSMLRLSSRS